MTTRRIALLFSLPCLAVLAPAGHSSDRWPPERFAELAARLADEFGLSILVEGAPADEPLLRAVVARAGHQGVQAATHPLGTCHAPALLPRARCPERSCSVTDTPRRSEAVFSNS